MKLHPEISRRLYFGVQAFRKEPVREELHKVNTEFYDSKQEIQDRVWQRGQETLLFALKNVDYYRKNCSSGMLLKAVSGIGNYQEFCDVLKEFPIIDKSTIIQHKQLFESDQAGSINGYQTYSSGSTGEPIAFKRDQRDWARAHANLIKILEMHGVQYGESHVYFWGGDWTTTNKFTNGVKNFIFNRIKIGAHNKSHDELRQQIAIIKKYKPYYIYSFPSCLERICQYLKIAGGNLRDIGIHKIFTTGENLRQESRLIIQEIFGVSVCDIYGCSEVGLIAFDCPKGNKHTLIDTNFIEVTADGAIIVTNFFQRKNVVLRYKVGDLCSHGISWKKCDCGLGYPIIGDLSGRDSKNYLLPNGKKITSLSVAYIFDSVIFDGSILEGRFVLNADGKMILYLVPGTNFSDKAVDTLTAEAKTLFEMDTVVEIVDAIPSARSGKKVDFISEWKGSQTV